MTTSSGCILLYWFYQCYKACHIPTPTQDSHNHIAIVLLSQLTVIGIQNESVFCSKPWTFLKSLLARKQSFILCIQFYSQIHRSAFKVHFVWNGQECRMNQRASVVGATSPRLGKGRSCSLHSRPCPRGRSQSPKPASALMSGQGCWSRSHKVWQQFPI